MFLGTIGKKMFYGQVGDMILASPRMLPALLFYILYIAGVVVFANGSDPADWTKSALYGALFGFFCYATFELTSMSLLKHWEWTVVFSDIAWGTIMTGIAAAVGGLIGMWISARI